MTIITRQITGPIETPDHEVVTTGTLFVGLLSPVADDDTFVAPYTLEYAITDGDLPADCKLVARGKYEFRIHDVVNSRVYSFQACLTDDSSDPISVAQLWLMAKLVAGECAPPCEGLDLANFGSNGAPDGYVLTADGDGGTNWEPVAGTGDMLKSVYDTNDDGCVNCADFASVADFAWDSDALGGNPPSYYQPKLPNGPFEGAILTWDVVQQIWAPNYNFAVDDDGGVHFGGPVYHNTSEVNQVYYEIDDETYILVTIAANAEVVLPDATAEDGRVISIKKASDTGFDVSVTVIGGGVIEGSASFELKRKYDAIKCVAIDGEWWIY